MTFASQFRDPLSLLLADPHAHAIIQGRRRLGWSQARLAKIVGTSQQTIDRIERGITKWSRMTPLILAAIEHADAAVEWPEAEPICRVTEEMMAAGAKCLRETATACPALAAEAVFLAMAEAAQQCGHLIPCYGPHERQGQSNNPAPFEKDMQH